MAEERKIVADDVQLNEKRETVVIGSFWMRPDQFKAAPDPDLVEPELLQIEGGKQSKGGLDQYYRVTDIAVAYFRVLKNACEVVAAPVPDNAGTVNPAMAARLLIRKWSHVICDGNAGLAAVTILGERVPLMKFLIWALHYDCEFAYSLGYWHLEVHNDAKTMEESREGLRVNLNLNTQLKHYLHESKTNKMLEEARFSAQRAMLASDFVKARKLAIFAEIQSLQSRTSFDADRDGVDAKVKALTTELSSIKVFTDDFASKKYAGSNGNVTQGYIDQQKNLSGSDIVILKNMMAFQGN